MKVLFICTNRYQIINAVNARINFYKNDTVHILIASERPELNKIWKKISDIELFDKVQHVYIQPDGLHEYIKKLKSNKNNLNTNITFVEACRATIFNGITKFKSIFNNEEYILKTSVSNYEYGDYKTYDIIFAHCNHRVINIIYKLIKENNVNCELAILDEGLGSYVRSNLGGKNTPADSAYLNEPSLCMYNIENVKALPKIDKNNDIFLNYINYIFSWSGEEIIFKNKIIFFQQEFDPMPEYLENPNIIVKYILYNSYRKHINDARLFYEQQDVVNELARYLSFSDIFIKYHPAEKNINRFVWEKNIKILDRHNLPWEIRVLNEKMEDNLFITIHSTAVLMHENIDAGHNKYIFLYKMINVSMDKLGEAAINKFKKIHAGKVYIPEDKDEFYNIVDNFINNH